MCMCKGFIPDSSPRRSICCDECREFATLARSSIFVIADVLPCHAMPSADRAKERERAKKRRKEEKDSKEQDKEGDGAGE